MYIVVEDTLAASYLLESCSRVLGPQTENVQVIVRTSRSVNELRARCVPPGTSQAAANAAIEAEYPGLSKTERAMIYRFGAPETSLVDWPRLLAAESINEEPVLRLLSSKQRMGQRWVLAFVDEVFGRKWMAEMDGRILVGHPGILPYARGMYALEGLARTRDRALFTAGAGGTLFLATERVDLGPIVCAIRPVDPWGYRSLADLRGSIFKMVFDLCAGVLPGLAGRERFEPCTFNPLPFKPGHVFTRKEATAKNREDAEAAYVEMTHSARQHSEANKDRTEGSR